MKFALLIVLLGLSLPASTSATEVEGDASQDQVASILKAHCLRCHQGQNREGDIDLSLPSTFLDGEGDEPIVVAGKPELSRLFQVISGEKPTMPKSGDRLDPKQVESLRNWIAEGAQWPDRVVLKVAPKDWWSLSPLASPAIPNTGAGWARNPIDAFLLAGMKAKGLTPSPEAGRRTLIRRVTYDLTGLPPSPQEVNAFLADKSPDAYERLVDRLLASPRHGERWARHWLDVVRYGETHGYDKDQPRLNAWPYRDYVIRAFNEDKTYHRFVEEQLAGDILYPESRDGIEALGFLSAGPWDFIGHAEVPETKYDGQVARLLDRDDMVSNALNTFSSLTVQCARCHDHKFDPVTQEDYYSLQAVFAALDRADRLYDIDPAMCRRRVQLDDRRKQQKREIEAILAAAKLRLGEPLEQLDIQIRRLESKKSGRTERSAAFGYHSGISTASDTVKWVQLDLGKSFRIDRVVLHACDDDFNGIGAGFGFPARFKVECSDDPRFDRDVVVIADRTTADFANPRLSPVELRTDQRLVRYIRVTATRLASRQNDFNFALAELEVIANDENVARNALVSAFDSIEAPPRWRLVNLVDGVYPIDGSVELAALRARREAMVSAALDVRDRDQLGLLRLHLSEIERDLATLPPQSRVYSGTVHHGTGAFRGTGHDGGKPREIRVLARGDLRSPRQVVGPGTVPIIDGVSARFNLPIDAPEGERRAALARWLTDRRNPLTWRSIVNRVWQYHFGRGLVESPNDFGRMGQLPSNPALLDWLAADFRDNGQSMKRLHRLIVTSAAYRQVTEIDPAKAKLDGDNVWLWRMNRRRLEAEAVRDSVLLAAGMLDLTMGGPSFRDFVVQHPEHSPHYEYQLFDPNDSQSYRRSIYRLIVRSQPHPFLTALDCADPSTSVDKRNESTTALQALALLNDRLIVTMAARFATRLENEAESVPARIDLGFLLSLGRMPTEAERAALVAHAEKFGLANACRILFNLNEFVFVD